MNDNDIRKQLHHAMDTRLSGMTGDPWLARRIVNGEPGSKMKKRGSVGLIVAIVLLCLAMTALAYSVYQSYFAGVAKLTLQSGDYEEWTLEEKRSMLQIMKESGFIEEETARALSKGSEEEIDAFMLKRYVPPDVSDGLGAISLMRIAWVEMGPYTDWPNETWVWFTDMMFEVGLWTDANDVDVYATPGDEAISPAAAIELAKQQLVREGIPADEVEQCQILWHYMTHASDVEQKELKYLITFRDENQKERYVWVTPDGKVV